MAKGFIARYFIRRRMNQLIDELLDFHVKRIKKSYMDRVIIRIKENGTDIGHKNSNAHIATIQVNGKEDKQRILTIQYENLRKSLDSFMVNFLNDNVIDLLKHEFAHLKYRGHGKDHEKWMKEIKLFKKDKKK